MTSPAHRPVQVQARPGRPYPLYDLAGHDGLMIGQSLLRSSDPHLSGLHDQCHGSPEDLVRELLEFARPRSNHLGEAQRIPEFDPVDVPYEQDLPL